MNRQEPLSPLEIDIVRGENVKALEIRFHHRNLSIRAEFDSDKLRLIGENERAGIEYTLLGFLMILNTIVENAETPQHNGIPLSKSGMIVTKKMNEVLLELELLNYQSIE